MARDLILVVDQGTTGTKSIIFDREGQMVARGYAKLTLRFPKPDWVEVMPDDVALSVEKAVRASLASVDASRLALIAVTNQRETCTFFDMNARRACYPFIVWQDRRTRDECEALPADLIARATGLRPHPYFSGTKLRWIRRACADAFARPGADMRAMTMDSYVIYLLGGGGAASMAASAAACPDVVTDPTNASRTLLYNIHEDRWDHELCRLFEVDPAHVPTVIPNGEIAGRSAGVYGLPAGIPIVAPIGDQQAAWVGSGALFESTLKLTIGTGSFAIGARAAADPRRRGLLETIGYHDAAAKKFGYEAVAFCSGLVIEWLMAQKWINDYAEIDALMPSEKLAIQFYPLFTDMGTPYWKKSSHGASFSGVTVGAAPRDLAQAAVDSIAFQSALILEQYDLARHSHIYLDGGVSQFAYMQAMLVRLVDKPIHVSRFADITAFGAWLGAARARMGVSDNDLHRAAAAHYEPIPVSGFDRAPYRRRFDAWKEGLGLTLGLG